MARRWRLLSLLALVALVMAACGGGKEEKTSGQSGAGGKKVKIGVIAPTSGDLSALGIGIRNSADLAIRQANEQKKIPGWTIEMAAEDDTAKADVGAQAASKLASDAQVAGVVGPLNSSVAQQVTPILERANIVEVSPANTNDTLTRGQDFKTNPQRPHRNYFRTATLDSFQGPFAADYAYKEAKIKTAAVIHDKKTYGQGLATEFKTEFEKDGGKVVAFETVNPGDKDFSAVLSKIKPLNPGMIYYGGEYPESSLITSQAKAPQVGLKVPLMGGDGMYDPTYIKVAGAAAEGDLATNVGAPPEQLPSAKSFIDAYNAAGFKDPFSAYGALSYDATNVIINALAKVLPGKSSIDDAVRRQVIDAVQATNFDGASGKIAFDQYGDTVTKVLTVYKVQGGKFTPVRTGQFTPTGTGGGATGGGTATTTGGTGTGTTTGGAGTATTSGGGGGTTPTSAY